MRTRLLVTCVLLAGLSTLMCKSGNKWDGESAGPTGPEIPAAEALPSGSETPTTDGPQITHENFTAEWWRWGAKITADIPGPWAMKVCVCDGQYKDQTLRGVIEDLVIKPGENTINLTPALAMLERPQCFVQFDLTTSDVECACPHPVGGAPVTYAAKVFWGDPSCGDTPCEDEPVLVTEEVIDIRPGICTEIIGEWGPIGCQKVDSLLKRYTWKQCDMMWTEEKWVRGEPEECPCPNPTPTPTPSPTPSPTPTPFPTCEKPADQAFLTPVDKQGNPRDECSYYGNYVPVCKTQAVSASTVEELPECEGLDPLFYICKQATKMVATLSRVDVCPFITPAGKSHETGCACAD